MPAMISRIAPISLTVSRPLRLGSITSFIYPLTCWAHGAQAGRPGGNRTPNLRFWRPPLCQLSYWPIQESSILYPQFSIRDPRSPILNPRSPILYPLSCLLNDLRHHPRTDRAPALADRKAQPLLHRDRRNQRHRHPDVVPRHHHLGARRQLHAPRHVRRAEIKLRPIPVEERRVAPALFLA